jgi:aminoglycoside phosphotransferase (APT) family kinase protein
MQQTAEVLADARAAGLPVPRHDVVIELHNGLVALVQERLPGAPAPRINATVIDAMVRTNERFAGLLANRPDVPIPAMWLGHSGPGQPDYDVLATHSARVRRLLGAIHEVYDNGPHAMIGDDLLHPDYTLGNVLYDNQGNVSGVVDWNWGVLRGDRHFALVKIYIDLCWMTLSPRGPARSAFNRLDEVVDELISPPLLRMYWSHITVNQLHFWIRDNNTEAIDLFLKFGESRLFS